MNAQELQAALRDLPLGGLRFFESIGSTNDEAPAWASQNASDLSLVVADEQTNGRGQLGRKWFTPPKTALTFSLILRPTSDEIKYPARVTGLGALALTDSISKLGLRAQIKWPNDVLINGKKTAGILVEINLDRRNCGRLCSGLGNQCYESVRAARGSSLISSNQHGKRIGPTD